ncbi:uncharacterized protein LOC123307083 [Coccinella septempunctata]|uniref:uncharacterized protein LOC123307083 n=1 Tax=Coccinella septempunctata TaxID=41139 RepID=UPI001D07A6F1|nr:uncharacterized protein LOC123307083 [Coccinella septempunctata]
MKMNSYFYLICFIPVINTASIFDENQNKEIIDLNLNNSEVDKLMTQQTEAIKKIVSDTQQIQLEYPQTEKPASDTTELKKNYTEINLEDLRVKCQHLERLFRANNSKFENDSQMNSKPVETSTPSMFRKKYPLTYPVYFQGRKDNKYSTPKIKGFYVTTVPTVATSQSTTPKTSKKEQPNVKYIKLEPVILQKTFLTNGKVVYYWHRSLPSAIQYQNSQQESETVPIPSTTQATTTTTASSIYSFRNLFPFYSMSNADSYQTESTTTSTTTASTTTTAPTPLQDDTKINQDFEDLATQLRFVLPVPYVDPENASRNPWDFDQFAYYPKHLQPTKINMQVPYVPTFHVIKALAVPNRYLSNLGNKNVNDEEKPKFS